MKRIFAFSLILTGLSTNSLFGQPAIAPPSPMDSTENLPPSEPALTVPSARSDYPAPISTEFGEWTPVEERALSESCDGISVCDTCPPKPSPPVNPFRVMFFENDFVSLQKSDHDYVLGEELKEVKPLGQWNLSVSVGGEIRHRYHNQENQIRPFGPAPDSFQLWRWRNYVDVKTDYFRVYAEMLDASQFGEDLPPLAVHVNRWNIQNLFVDINLFERDGKPVVLRYGRQELLYGIHRLITPLDFANTRRNFDGFKLFSKGETWDIDAFATRPVNTAAGHGTVAQFDNEADHPDYSRTFSGVYATWHGVENRGVDLYWLWLREQDERARPVGFPDGSRHTVGARYFGTHPIKDCCDNVARTWSWDLEGGYQYGHDEFVELVQAGFLTATLGHQWNALTWKPKLEALYWFGSGDRDPNDDTNNTFTPLFPLAHAYWGVIDNLGGPNLKDYALLATLQPTEKLKIRTAIHWFDLADNEDVLYNVGQVPVGRPNTGTHIGEEWDLIVDYQFNPNFSIQAQYAMFWYGTFVDNNIPRDDARQFFIQSQLRY